MASRAATLVESKRIAKTKSKNPAAKIVSKSSAEKIPSLKANSLKSSPLKSSPLKSSPLKSPTLKSNLLKPTLKTSSAPKSSGSKLAIAQARMEKPGTDTAPSSKSKMLKSVPVKSATKIVKASAVAVATKAPAASGPAVIAGAASFESAAPKPRRRTKGEIRTRIYWAVFNQSLRRVAVFEFDQREEAEKRAAKLAKASGEHHFLQKIKAIVQ